MKRLLILSITALCLLGSGCTKWLDTERDDLFLEKDQYSNETGINNALNGLYRTMMSDDLYGDKLNVGTVDFLAHYFDYPENDAALISKSDLRDLWELGAYDYNDAMVKKYFDPIWDSGYKFIRGINTFIKNVTESEVLDEKVRDLFLGEAYGLRAMMHLDLYRLYGPVSVDGTSGVMPYNANVAISVLEYLDAKTFLAGADISVMKDLDMAEKLLEDTDPIYLDKKVYDGASDDLYLNDEERFATMFRNKRMNYWAVQVLKMRVHMLLDTDDDKTKVIQIAERIIEEAVDETYINYTARPMTQKAKAFGWSPLGMDDADWEANPIAYDEVIMGPSYIDLKAWWLDYLESSIASASTRVLIATNLINNIFGGNESSTLDQILDRRIEQFVTSGIEQQEVGSFVGQYYVSNKYSGKNVASSVLDNKGYMEYNTYDMRPLIRLAEVQYMKAEVLLKQSDIPGAIAALNTVLAHRGYQSETDTYDPTRQLPAGVSEDDVRDMLTREYYREFVYEGQAFFYMKRNAMTTIMSGYGGGSAGYMPADTRVNIELESYVPPRPLAERDYDTEPKGEEEKGEEGETEE